MIETKSLTKKYGELIALNNLNLEVQEGECVGFIGPNGAGKTTTIKILATLLRPSWGEARINGLSVGPVNAREVRRMIGYVPDYFGVYEGMVTTEYLEFFAANYGIHGADRKNIVRDVLDLTDLSTKAEDDVNGLSRGMKQRLSVARVLLHDPKVLLLDEPASGLDPRARIEMRELLKELHRMGKTILISSHILLELADLVSSVVIIEKGQMRFTGTINEILSRAKGGEGTGYQIKVVSRYADAENTLQNTPGVLEVKREDSVISIRIDDQRTGPDQIAAALVNGGFALAGLEQEQVNLETAFMRLTKSLVQ